MVVAPVTITREVALTSSQVQAGVAHWPKTVAETTIALDKDVALVYRAGGRNSGKRAG